LKRKDLLDFLLDRRERLLGIGYSMEGKDEYDELLELKLHDLIELKVTRWWLTEFGKKFLARYELGIQPA
jgi:hypothetical protein